MTKTGADRCSFCGRQHPQIAQLIEAPGRAAFICNECTDRAHELVKQNKKAGSDFSLEELPSPREIKAGEDFIAKREEVLSMIWEMEEEIMGRAPGQAASA